jgi:hypothetical protein
MTKRKERSPAPPRSRRGDLVKVLFRHHAVTTLALGAVKRAVAAIDQVLGRFARRNSATSIEIVMGEISSPVRQRHNPSRLFSAIAAEEGAHVGGQ